MSKKNHEYQEAQKHNPFFIFSTHEKEKTGKSSKNTFKRGSSLVVVNPSDTKKTKDLVKNENKVKTKSKFMKTKRRNSVPPDKENKGLERKVGVSQLNKKNPTTSSLLATDTFKTEPSKKNSISDFVQNNLLEKIKISGDIPRRSRSLEQLNTLRKSFLTVFFTVCLCLFAHNLSKLHIKLSDNEKV